MIKIKFSKILNKILLVSVIFTFMTVNIKTQEMAVPANLQAALFKKIFMFDNTLSSKGNYEVAVLTGAGSGDEIVTAFKAAGMNAKSYSGNQIPDGAAVIYIMPGVTAPKQQSASKGVLSISGVTSNVESGNVAIGLGIEGSKPKIIVHMGQLKAENHEVSANLLKLAKVIQ